MISEEGESSDVVRIYKRAHKCSHGYAFKPIVMGMASPVVEILPLFPLLSKWPNFPFGPWAIVHGGQKIESAQKINASRG